MPLVLKLCHICENNLGKKKKREKQYAADVKVLPSHFSRFILSASVGLAQPDKVLTYQMFHVIK